MKKLQLAVFIFLVSLTAFGQLTTTLVVSANPPGSLTDWANRKEVLTYIVSNQTGAARQAIIKAELRTSDGTLAASTNLAKAPIVSINDGTTILSANEVLALQALIFNGRFKTVFDRTGKLPAGSYQLCAQLVNPIDFLPLSEQRCRVFNLAAFQLPIPVLPGNEMLLDMDKAKTTITFRWTPVTPRPTEVITYRILVFEVLENQTPMQALRSNQPLLQKDIQGTTQYIWQHQLVFVPFINTDSTKAAEKSKIDSTLSHFKTSSDLHANNNGTISTNINDASVFIWTIQSFDQQGRPFGDGNINGDGITEPVVFFVDRRAIPQRNATPPLRVIRWLHR